MTTYVIWVQKIDFSKTISVLIATLFFVIWKHLLKRIIYKKTGEWHNEWALMTTSDSEWYNEWQRMTASDNEWYN